MYSHHRRMLALLVIATVFVTVLSTLFTGQPRTVQADQPDLGR